MSLRTSSQATYEVTITGVSPYLQHRFRIEDHAADVETGSSKKTPKIKVWIPEVEAEKAIYRDKNTGNIYLPSDQLLMSTSNAGVNFIYEGRKTFKFILPSLLVFEPENIPLISNGSIAESWEEIDVRPVVVNRGRVIRYRPRWNSWSASFSVQCLNTNVITPETIRDIFDDAGKFFGIGDFRPRFGRFYVSSFKDGEEELVEQEHAA